MHGSPSLRHDCEIGNVRFSFATGTGRASENCLLGRENKPPIIGGLKFSSNHETVTGAALLVENLSKIAVVVRAWDDEVRDFLGRVHSPVRV